MNDETYEYQEPTTYSEDPINYQNIKKNIIFLDFDGTTRPITNWSSKHPQMPLIFEAIKDNLNDISIIISSTWKRHNSKEDLFDSIDENYHQYIHGATPDILNHLEDGSRSIEINLFLKNLPKQTTYNLIILDDMPNLFNKKHTKNLTPINPETGFSEDDITKLKNTLNNYGENITPEKNVVKNKPKKP